jgi:hypothetical protein
MRFMVLVKASKDSEAGVMPTEEMFAEMGKYNEELVKAGVMISGDGLHPSSRGARVHFSGKDRKVIDGPFAETKELVAGFWMWECASLQEAIDWVKRCPNPMPGDSDIEIRQCLRLRILARLSRRSSRRRRNGCARRCRASQPEVIRKQLDHSGAARASRSPIPRQLAPAARFSSTRHPRRSCG